MKNRTVNLFQTTEVHLFRPILTLFARDQVIKIVAIRALLHSETL